MGILKRRPVLVGIVITLVVALLAATAYVTVLHPRRASNRASNNVAVVAPGMSVVLPKGMDAASYKLAARPASLATLRSLKGSAIKPLAKPLDFTSAKPIPQGTKLQAQLPRGIKTPVFEAAYDAVKNQWVADPTTYDPATGIATARVAHFSPRDWFTWVKDRIVALLQGALQHVYGVLAREPLKEPSCGSRHGVEMFETNVNGAILSCHDATVQEAPQPGKPGTADVGVRLVNARGYPIDVIVPADASVSTSDAGSLPQLAGAAITDLVATDPGTKRVLLSGNASARIILHDVPAPFTSVKIATQVDGQAFLMSVAVTGVEELAELTKIKDIPRLTRNLIEAIKTAKPVGQALIDMKGADLSPETMKKLGGLALEILSKTYENFGPLAAAGIISLIISLGDELVQGLWGFVDSAMGNSYHKFTFGTYGSFWSQPTTDLHQVDWGNVTIPGGWFRGPASVKLHDGTAKGVPTTIPNPLTNTNNETEEVSAAPDQVVYGDLDGDGRDEAAMYVLVNPVGVAAADRAAGWVVFRGGSNGPEVIGVATPRVHPYNTWDPEGKDAHIPLLKSAEIQRDRVVVQEFYYQSSDATCCPSGRATTTWSFSNGGLAPGTPQVTQ
jgi:hypothetical protein